jgi:peptidoglycan/LPS O-acetylase OafA/YrhL
MPYKLTLLWQLQYFLVGFLVTDFFLVDWRGQNQGQGSWWWDIVALVGLIVMALSWSADFPKRLLFSIALLAFLVAGFRGRWFTDFLRKPWIAVIGGMCYTIYLIHLPLLEGLTPITTKLAFTNIFGVNLLLQAVLVFPVVLAVSAVGFLWLEKPCMDKDWATKLWARIRSSKLVLNKTKE